VLGIKNRRSPPFQGNRTLTSQKDTGERNALSRRSFCLRGVGIGELTLLLFSGLTHYGGNVNSDDSWKIARSRTLMRESPRKRRRRGLFLGVFNGVSLPFFGKPSSVPSINKLPEKEACFQPSELIGWTPPLVHGLVEELRPDIIFHRELSDGVVEPSYLDRCLWEMYRAVFLSLLGPTT